MIYKLFFFVVVGVLFSPAGYAETVDGWDIRLLEPVKYETHLNHTREVQIYTGDYVLRETTKTASAGKKFAFAYVSVSPQKVNVSSFNPNLFVAKNGKAVFSRIDDDAFLLDFSMRPLPHLNIRRGSHTGYLVYEIPVTVDGVSLFYDKQILKVDTDKGN